MMLAIAPSTASALAASDTVVPAFVYTTPSSLAAQPLTGARLAPDFTARFNFDVATVVSATYYLDADITRNSPRVTVNRAPFGVRFTAANAALLPAGQHQLLAVVRTSSNTRFTVSSVFTSAPATTGIPAVSPSAPVATQPSANNPTATPTGGTEVCEKFGSTNVSNGAYMVQNNVWGDDTEQCVIAFDGGFRITKASHDKADGPAAFPSIMSGCWMQTCTAGSPLPLPVTGLPPITSSWRVTVPATGRTNVAYDIWADPTPRKDGQNTGAELMIWLREQGGVDPIGTKTATAQLGGTTWDVWTGKNGATPVISWVRTTPTNTVTNLPITDFVNDAMTRGVVQQGWYLTNIQAGFEPWTGGQGLSTDSFSVTY